MRRELSNQIGQVCFAQFLLFRQARSTEGHAQGKGLTLMGNLPFFVSADWIDVWANPSFFFWTSSVGHVLSPVYGNVQQCAVTPELHKPWRIQSSRGCRFSIV
jgi:4-alpha-glucanotransferase